jgi:hypothetical protein
VLDLVPLAGAGRKMTYRDGKTGLVAELLKLSFPELESGAARILRCFSFRDGLSGLKRFRIWSALIHVEQHE